MPQRKWPAVQPEADEFTSLILSLPIGKWSLPRRLLFKVVLQGLALQKLDKYAATIMKVETVLSLILVKVFLLVEGPRTR